MIQSVCLAVKDEDFTTKQWLNYKPKIELLRNEMQENDLFFMGTKTNVREEIHPEDFSPDGDEGSNNRGSFHWWWPPSPPTYILSFPTFIQFLMGKR